MLAAQISASAESVTYEMDSDKEPSMTIPVTLGTMPEDLHLIVTPARGFVNGTEIYYQYGKNYRAESDTHIDTKITGISAGWNGKLAVCLRENMFLGMGIPSQKDDYMMRNQSNIFAEITVTESCTIPNSRRTITLNDTVTNAVTVRANITAGNVLEGERLYAYAKYWPSAQEESAGRYTEDVRLDSQNNYTGDLVCYPQLVGTITLNSGRRSSKNIYEIIKNLPCWGRSFSDLLHFRDWFQIKMNFNRNVSCLIAVYFFMDNDFLNQLV